MAHKTHAKPAFSVANLHRQALEGLFRQVQALEEQPTGSDTASEMANLARAIAALTAEVRKHSDAVLETLDGLDHVRRADLILGLLDDLPVEHRRRVQARLLELGDAL